MTFPIRQLDNLDYDKAELLLEDYISAAIQSFVDSETGQEYIKTHPEGGSWIGTFIEMAYIYGGYTLSKMTKGNVQEVMEYILPRKLTLLDPSDTDDAIDELVAFWTYLHREYKLRSANAIVKYLRSIKDQFPKWMFDPERSGMAKSFTLQGLEAGYDMTTQEGLQAFQAEYNRNLSQQSPAIPADMQAAFEQLGLELPQAEEPINPNALISQFLGALAELEPEALEAMISTLEDDFEADPITLPSPGEALEDIRLSLMRESLENGFPPLSEEEETILHNQVISETAPGTILKDFQTTLDFIGDGVPVSNKLKQLSAKLLADLNSRLSNPIETDLKRPMQKSYPSIHGLYLLLRATGIAEISAKGKKLQMVLNPDVYASWQKLNPTEKYFTLLEAWIVRGHPEMLGNERSGPMTMGDRIIHSWPRLVQEKSLTFKDAKDYDWFSYYPGFENIFLMEMFGLLNLTLSKPAPGKGWQMKQLQPHPWGHALVKVIYNAYVNANLQWNSQNDATHPFGELQPALQPYFPEWQQNLTALSYPFRPERHIFKVSLGKCWRRIAMSGEATLAEFSRYILDSVEFDSDHLDQFTYQAPNGRTVQVTHPWADGDVTTDEVQIGSLLLHEGSTMEYLFDFGDCWEFQIQLESIEPPVTPQESAKVKQTAKARKSTRRSPMGEILEVHGKAPEQYPDYDTPR
ncbi:hypothetical protein AWQ21_15335 (plasmid) [Picosynechococcus sp. PCC 7003]|uniref:IS1096 element passenger TnpR family protein n=1 Tax=Picosynechococcus sp. PCC 7003 TaxID=374981 RepID=UPI0008103C82|nr:hypothetical protein [Picosynechococcus sp. PCC 7003]ANV85901.1 hypothetical protein AWQ21_15335 [Picosynechococcus sp. PCC 7003]